MVLLLLVLGAIVAGVWALKNHFFPPVELDPEPTATAPVGPTEEDLANPTECATEVLEVAVALAADSLPAGQAANIPVTVRNTGEVPCLLDVGRESVTVTITSGDDQVWVSTHCGAGLPSERRILLDVDAADTTVVAWSGTRSAPGCPGDQPATTSGTYRLYAEVLAGGGSAGIEQVFGMH